MRFALRLADTKILWMSFLATVLCTIVFQVLVHHFDLVLLDALSDPIEIHRAIASMSDQQRLIHAWMTGTLDLIYPMAYGALFVGSAYKFFPTKGFFLSLPVLICIPVDLAEGVVQIFSLAGCVEWTQLKEFLTPLKQMLFVTALLLTISGWVKWLYLKVVMGCGT